MSSSFHSKTKKFDPAGHEVVEGVFGIEKADEAAKAAEAAAKAETDSRTDADARAAEALKVKQVGTREQNVRSTAAAAGVTRPGNEQDFLLARAPTKRKYASRTLLGE
jgi:hypothetical protein